MIAKKKTGLGRGLSALLEGADEQFTQGISFGDGSESWLHGNIPVNDIASNPYQPRTEFEEESLRELSDSIKQQGIIQPITVRKTSNDQYQLISGERRLKAAILAGLTSIPAFIRTADDIQMLELALVENIQRKDLNPLEVAISFQRMLEELDYSRDIIAEKVGKNRSTITNYLRLLKLPPQVQIALRDDKISMGHARALINLEDNETQLAILKNILNKGLSVREVEKIVQDLNKPEQPPKTIVIVLPEKLGLKKKQLEKKLGGNITVNQNKKGKGSIVLPFKSEKELEDIFNSLL
jgi:ParB family chromosome partitioning protein